MPDPLDELIAAARAAWPSIEVSTERFAAYVMERLPEGSDVAQAIASLHSSDLYLACACADGDAAAIAAFDRHCMAAIDPALARLGIASDIVAEVKQRMRRSLLVADTGAPKIAGFAGRGDVRRWVRVMAVREAIALARAGRKHASAGDEALADAVATDDDPEVQVLKRTYRDAFQIAFGEALEQLTDRERLVLRQHFLDGVNVQRLAKLHRVHRVTATRWLDGARTTLLATTRALLMKRLAISPAELDSIMRLIQSQLGVTLRGLYRRRPA